jgi:hypothetical protein
MSLSDYLQSHHQFNCISKSHTGQTGLHMNGAENTLEFSLLVSQVTQRLSTADGGDAGPGTLQGEWDLNAPHHNS